MTNACSDECPLTTVRTVVNTYSGGVNAKNVGGTDGAGQDGAGQGNLPELGTHERDLARLLRAQYDDRRVLVVTGAITLACIVVAVVAVLSMVLGAIDVVRQPGWAWTAAGEPQLLCLLIVLAIPGVGLAVYVFGPRPKVLASVAAGPVTVIPFDYFSNLEAAAVETDRPLDMLTLPATLGRSGVPPTDRPRVAGDPGSDVEPQNRFFEDPDVVTVTGQPDGESHGESEATTIRIPGSVGRPYHPLQRTSLDQTKDETETRVGSRDTAGV